MSLMGQHRKFVGLRANCRQSGRPTGLYRPDRDTRGDGI